MSGHYATLLRGTLQTLLIDQEVYVTDWNNIRDTPGDAGVFDLSFVALRIGGVRLPLRRAARA